MTYDRPTMNARLKQAQGL